MSFATSGTGGGAGTGLRAKKVPRLAGIFRCCGGALNVVISPCTKRICRAQSAGVRISMYGIGAHGSRAPRLPTISNRSSA